LASDSKFVEWSRGDYGQPLWKSCQVNCARKYSPNLFLLFLFY